MPHHDEPPQPNAAEEFNTRKELAQFKEPKDRIAFLKSQGIEHHFLISGPELASIQGGTEKLNGELHKWRILAQAVHGTTNPEDALEQHKKQSAHRARMVKDVGDFRNALLDIVAMAPNSTAAVRARKALNHED